MMGKKLFGSHSDNGILVAQQANPPSAARRGLRKLIESEELFARKISSHGMIESYVEMEKRSHGKGKPKPEWGVWNTPLSDYAQPLAYNVEAAVLKGECRVLDVGMGSGAQWEGALSENPKIDFYGTVLTIEWVREKMKPHAIITDAASLAKIFVASFFDLALSRFGMHCQEVEGLQAIHEVLKPGGDAVVIGHKPSMRKAVGEAVGKGMYRVVSKQIGTVQASYALRKLE